MTCLFGSCGLSFHGMNSIHDIEELAEMLSLDFSLLINAMKYHCMYQVLEEKIETNLKLPSPEGDIRHGPGKSSGMRFLK